MEPVFPSVSRYPKGALKADEAPWAFGNPLHPVAPFITSELCNDFTEFLIPKLLESGYSTRQAQKQIIMPSATLDHDIKPPLHVLIAGAGIVGLTIAQGCKQNGIPFTIFERDDHRAARNQGWALTLHWCLRSLRRTVGPELSKEFPKVSTIKSEAICTFEAVLMLILLLTQATVDPTLKLDAGNFLFLNAETGAVRYKIPPAKERLRLNRLRLLDALSAGLDIQWGKNLTSYGELPDGSIKVHFKDGSSTTGSMLIGADGNNSNGTTFLHILK